MFPFFCCSHLLQSHWSKFDVYTSIPDYWTEELVPWDHPVYPEDVDGESPVRLTQRKVDRSFYQVDQSLNKDECRILLSTKHVHMIHQTDYQNYH